MARIAILGSGLAGLYAALKLAPLPVTLVTGLPITKGSSSAWAQGGIAAALGPDDSLEAHVADTVAAGAGLVDADLVRKMAADASDRILDLARLGVPFDRDAKGDFSLGREGAHSHNRIVRVQGDRAGAAIMDAIKARVRETPSITVVEGYSGYELLSHGGAIAGLMAAPVSGQRSNQGDHLRIAANHVVLATGGCGGLYAVTTNPKEAVGEGVAMAARLGALLADMEFVQFHPTGFDIGRDPAPLATEALRGEGAVLVNDKSERFMPAEHELAELAPRDIVARAIHKQILSGHKVFLDAREAVGAEFPDRFPTVYKTCKEAGIDPVTDPLPVAPAAHYHMGGIAVNERGRSSLPGLWAIGEVTCSGIHGANRLASNSLLETLFLAHGAAVDIAERSASVDPCPVAEVAAPNGAPATELVTDLRRLMSNHAGVVRNATGLREAMERLTIWSEQATSPALTNRLTTASLIARAALARTESRGGHYREDYPEPDDKLKQHSLWQRTDDDWSHRWAPTIAEGLNEMAIVEGESAATPSRPRA